MSVYVRGLGSNFIIAPSPSYEEQLESKTGIPFAELLLTQCSKPVKHIDPSYTLEISLRTLGGKGGFGALLKGQGIIVRVDNFEACRDLNGRRVRHINNEIRLREWKKKKEDERQFMEEHLGTTEDSRKPTRMKRQIDEEYLEDASSSMSSVKRALAEARKRRKTKESAEEPSKERPESA